MTISLNEIQSRAIAFSKEWEDETSEDAEAKSFWDDFFHVFGVSRRRVAVFEKPVKVSDEKGGNIDLLWKGQILVEHKSRGKNLDKAFQQAKNYFPGLKDSDLPKYILVSDFARFRLYDLETDTQIEFLLSEFPNKIRYFGFMTGYQKQIYPPQDPVNIKAAMALGKLHDSLKDNNYTGHNLEVYLVRLLFCLFAEDTGIFEKSSFREFLETRTNEDGSDLAGHIEELFDTLNTPENKRLKNLDESLKGFPYIDGRLFEERLRIAAFDSSMRTQLLNCTTLDWGRISPAIFGSLFQSVMSLEARRELGAHYTAEENILKVIKPLFLDDLYNEFERVKNNRKQLIQFYEKICKLKFLDPACGCGNFLVITYRELRLLEIEILKKTHKGQQVLDSRLDVDNFYGFEIEEFPSQIAQVALWLMDHQMNMVLSQTFGHTFTRFPLTKRPGIFNINALQTNWSDIVPPRELSYILGNPPFTGSKLLNDTQREEMKSVFKGAQNSGILDYVSAWYIKAAEYIQGTDIKVGYVSTNSISQGEQVGALWNILLNEYNVKIHFAHRTFKWSSEARGKAAVHCVIIGFALTVPENPVIFEYETTEGEAYKIKAKHINPYLVDAPDVILENRTNPICDVPKIGIGNKPIDGGFYLFTKEEKDAFIVKEPGAAKWMKPWIGSDEFINGYQRFCLWLGDCPPDELRKLPEAMKRIEAVRQFRLTSKSKPTQKLANTPTRFHVENIPKTPFIVIPEVSSERRKYIPMGFLTPDYLCSNLVKILPDATLYHFSILTSSMHMAWMRAVAGRLESRYRYSSGIVYNNFPWPNPTKPQITAIENAANEILEVRKQFPDSSLADLYDPRTMPRELVKAHERLDALVEKAYGKRFEKDFERVKFLFEKYFELTTMT